MERTYLEWINEAYHTLIKDKNLNRMDLTTHDGKISVYRVKNIIRVDINREETKC